MKIINFLKKMKSEGVEFNELITLPLMIDQLDDYAHESDNHKRAWSLMILYRDALDQPLILSQFIPCDSEGKPLEKPRYYDVWDKENNTLTDDATILSLHKYKQALKAVIFEGWKIDVKEASDIILINGDYEIYFLKVKEGFVIQFCNITKPNGESIRPKTISDLANATQDNPINLR